MAAPYTNKTRLTDTAAERFPLLPEKGQKFVADEGQPGLYLRIGKSGKSWVVQREVQTLGDDMKPKRKTVRRAIGPFPGMGVKEARGAAQKRAGRHCGG